MLEVACYTTLTGSAVSAVRRVGLWLSIVWTRCSGRSNNQLLDTRTIAVMPVLLVPFQLQSRRSEANTRWLDPRTPFGSTHGMDPGIQDVVVYTGGHVDVPWTQPQQSPTAWPDANGLRSSGESFFLTNSTRY